MEHYLIKLILDRNIKFMIADYLRGAHSFMCSGLYPLPKSKLSLN